MTLPRDRGLGPGRRHRTSSPKTGAVALARQRLGEAIRLHESRAPAFTVIVTLQVAVEVLIDHAKDANRELGPFPRSEKPHRDRIEAARILAACGLLDDEVPILVTELAQMSGLSRYGEVEPHPATIEKHIAVTKAMLAEGPNQQAA